MRQFSRKKRTYLRLETLEVRANPAPALLGSSSLPGAGSPWDYSRAPFEASAIFADLEGDGPQEVLAPGGDGNLHAYRHNNGRLELARTFATGQTAQIQSTPLVVDLLGTRAVFVGNINGTVFGWNARTGQFLQGWPQSVYAPTEGPAGTGIYGAMAAGDLDGDFIPEIVVSAFNHEITAFRHNGSKLWQFNNDDTVFSSVAIGDLNRDGKPEVVVGGDSSASAFYWDGGRVNVLSNEGRRLWVKRTDQVIWSSPVLVDLNSDGYLEIVVGTGYIGPNAGNQVYALDHLGNDVAGWPYITHPSATFPGQTLPAPAVADLDGDGTLEIVIGDAAGRLHALRGNGQPLWVVQAFDPQVLWTSPIIADANGDGRPDVLMGAESVLKAFDGRTGSTIWQQFDFIPHYGAGAVGHFKGDASWQVAFIGYLRGAGGALLSPSSVSVYNLDATSLTPPWAMFRQDAEGNAVSRPDSSVRPLITKLYQVVLKRNPAQSEVDQWTRGFMRAPGFRPWIQAVTGSFEARGLQINSWYQDYLRRSAEQFGMDGWQQYLAAGNSYNSARAGIIASDEAFNKAGGTNVGWVSYLYQTLLGRSPGPGEADGWVTLLNTGQLVRGTLVPRFQGAPETLAKLINGWYAGFQPNGQTTASEDNLTAMSWDIRRGKPEEQVLTDMLTAHGDYLTTQNEGTWIRALYQDLVKRAPSMTEMVNWQKALEAGTHNLNSIANVVVKSSEYHHALVDGWFRTYLGRGSSEAERFGIVDALNRGARRQDQLVALFQGEEYFNRANRDLNTFITNVFTHTWGFGPSAQQRAEWQAKSGTENIRVTLPTSNLVWFPQGYVLRSLDVMYLDLLRRLPSTPPDSSRLIAAGTPNGAQPWFDAWMAGTNPADIQVVLLTSAEYQSLARTKAFWTGARWLS